MAETTWKQAVYDIADAYREAEGITDKISIADLKEKVREGSGIQYTGPNPLTIGQDGYEFDPKTLLKNGLKILNGVSDEGQYVWGKYESFLPDISISMNLPSTASAILTVECDLVDLTQVDVNFFAGYKGYVTVHGFACPLEFLENGKALFTWDGTVYEKNVVYTPSTKTMTIDDNWSGVFTNTFTKGDGRTVFSGYVTDDDENAYPNNGEQNGYYYIKVEGTKKTIIKTGSYTTASEVKDTLYIPHGLPKTPNYVALTRVSLKISSSYITANLTITADATNIIINGLESSIRIPASQTINWIAVI